MRWDQDHESPDVIDRRGEGGGGRGGISGLVFGLAPLLLRSRAGVVVLLLLVVGSVVARMFGTRDEVASPVAEKPGVTAGPDNERHFVSFVLDDAQQTWKDIFAKSGRPYRNAKLVLFTDATSTACGYGEAATGPFYCPSDERVYIDLSFYDELARRFGAKGDFAQAYVVAHEIGHHVQNELGISNVMRGLRRSEREGETGASVRLELQADCFAGVWAHSTRSRGLLDPGDVDEALRAASSVGDDRLQRQARGRVTPETFTHGTAAQRAHWFRVGLDSGNVDACHTFDASPL